MDSRVDYRVEVFALGLAGLGATVVAIVLFAVGALTPALMGSPAMLVGVAGSLLARFAAKRAGGFRRAKSDELFLVGTLLCGWSLLVGSVFFVLLCGIGIKHWGESAGWGWPITTLTTIAVIACLAIVHAKRGQHASISWTKGAPFTGTRARVRQQEAQPRAGTLGSITVLEALVAVMLLGSGPLGWLVLLLWHDSKVRADAQLLEIQRIQQVESARSAADWDYAHREHMQAERRAHEYYEQEQRLRQIEEELARERARHREQEFGSESGNAVLDAFLELGLSPSVSFEDVKKAHQRLALQFHPDRTAQLPASEREYCTARFRRIQRAFETLRIHFRR